MCMLSAVVGIATGTITQHDAEHAWGNKACHLVHQKQTPCNSTVKFLLCVWDRSSCWKGIWHLITTVRQCTLSITKYITRYSLLAATVAFTASAITLVLASWTWPELILSPGSIRSDESKTVASPVYKHINLWCDHADINWNKHQPSSVTNKTQINMYNHHWPRITLL